MFIGPGPSCCLPSPHPVRRRRACALVDLRLATSAPPFTLIRKAPSHRIHAPDRHLCHPSQVSNSLKQCHSLHTCSRCGLAPSAGSLRSVNPGMRPARLSPGRPPLSGTFARVGQQCTNSESTRGSHLFADNESFHERLRSLALLGIYTRHLFSCARNQRVEESQESERGHSLRRSSLAARTS